MAHGYTFGIHLRDEFKPTYRVQPNWYCTINLDGDTTDTTIFFHSVEQMDALILALNSMKTEWIAKLDKVEVA